ncbi:hypothetical protein L6452_15885 [Arctium lappa]|uniref:Uncharacterized protein n=1 Tax=Arctium lappa TaxID=4217 RepID=A0ACB9CQ40_ARCLA|nr:hypothetical protein L6452_15885 [Arctium lappa]
MSFKKCRKNVRCWWLCWCCDVEKERSYWYSICSNVVSVLVCVFFKSMIKGLLTEQYKSKKSLVVVDGGGLVSLLRGLGRRR